MNNALELLARMAPMGRMANPMRGLGIPTQAQPRRPIREHEIDPDRILKPYFPLFFRTPSGEPGMMPLEDPRFPIT